MAPYNNNNNIDDYESDGPPAANGSVTERAGGDRVDRGSTVAGILMPLADVREREREQAGPVDPFLPPNRPSTPLHHLPLEDRLQQADLPQEEELQRQRRRVSLARLQRVIAEEMYWMERVVTAEMTEDREEILRLVEVAHVSAERLLIEVRVLNQVV